MRMRYAALAATAMLLAAIAATILLTSAISPRPASAAQQTVPHSLAPAPVKPVTPQGTHTLTVTAGPGGSVDPAGATTHDEAAEVTLTASWNDATHTFAGWSGDCSGTATTCTLEMYANASVTAAFTPLPTDRCASPTDADCIRAVYKGAPDDYAQVQDIPDSVLIQPDSDGRYQVERGQQITVVTAAPLPTGYTRFYLQRRPQQVTVSPTSAQQLIPPVGTTYTFTVATDERGSTLLSYDLTAARPLPISRPGIKPQLGDVVVTTAFQVETTTLRYHAYATTGAVTTAGSYAFLSDPADTTSAVSTYEGLRDGATTGLLIHKSDTHGASQAALYDSVEADDLFEWRHADDCWVRYTVTEVKPDPTGIVPRKLLAVEWMTYAFTGCSGAVSTTVAASFAWGSLPDVGGVSLTAPVVHGPFQIMPEGWTGDTQEPQTRSPKGYSVANPAGGRDIAAARLLPYWRDPVLPDGATFAWASSGDVADPIYGYSAEFHGGESDVEIEGYDTAYRSHPEKATWLNGRGARETRVIAGRPAVVIYSPRGPSHDERFPVTVWVYDSETEATYQVHGLNTNLRGKNVDPVIAIARSLFEPEAQP